MRISPILCGLGLGMGLLVGACKPGGGQETDAGTGGESETDNCTPGVEGCVCGDDASCEPDLLCASNVCIAHEAMTTSGPTSQVTTTEDTGATGTPTETGGHMTGVGTETGTSECDPGEGVQNPACTNPAALYCSADGICAGCDAITCAEVSSATPICDGATGSCVQCTAEDASACGQTKPICDTAAGSCAACTAHGQCDSGACQLATGACFETVLYVDSGAECATGNGTMDLPFCEIQEAAATIGMGDAAAILVQPSSAAYSKQVQIVPGSTVAIVRDGSGPAKLEVGALDSLVVNDDATVYLHGLQISQGANKGLYCSNAAVWLDHVQVINRMGLGLDGVDCALRLRQSRVWLNLGGGIRLNGGSLRLENSFVVTNGSSFSAVSGVVVTNGTDIEALYSTIADNDGKAGVENSLDCVNPGTVALRNSIVFGQMAASSVDCPTATATTSVVDSAALTGEGNMTLDALQPEWFVMPADGDFAVKAGAPFEGVAVWKVGDPTSDYDGDPRPEREGAADYAGADRPK